MFVVMVVRALSFPTYAFTDIVGVAADHEHGGRGGFPLFPGEDFPARERGAVPSLSTHRPGTAPPVSAYGRSRAVQERDAELDDCGVGRSTRSTALVEVTSGWVATTRVVSSRTVSPARMEV